MDKLIENLKKRGFEARAFKTEEELAAALLELIGKGESVGIGGSTTISELGLKVLLEQNGHIVYSHAELKGEEAKATRMLAHRADVYLLSCNAITKDGIILNVDGAGNRVASSIYGVPTVVFIAGKNKITQNVEEGLWRLKNVANPKNVRRLGLDLPCAEADKCIDCGSPKCICRVTVMHEHPASLTRTLVFMLDKELGY